MSIAFNPAIPVFRIFSVEKAREFYLDFLAFKLDWEHRFEPDFPVYMQVSRGALVLHLSEHHGDACPGSTAYVRMRGVRDWAEAEMTVTDPFGNRIRFGEIGATKD